MTDYPYDPDLPYVVARIKESEPDFPVGIIARFKDKYYAEVVAGRFIPGWVEMVDTTPEPKIPADAEFIYWQTSWKNTAAREGLNPEKPWACDGVLMSEEELIAEIGSAEVVVLKRA